MTITRRSLLQSFVVLLAARRARAAAVVSTLVGTGTAGFSDQQVNNPYGVIFGPDGGLYFCDLDNQRIRRLDLRTRRMTTIAGNGQKGYAGDGGPATAASLNMPHEIQFDARGHLYIAERDNHVIRKVDGSTGADLDVRRHERRRIFRRRRTGRTRATAAAAQHRDRSSGTAADLRHRESANSEGGSFNRSDRHLRRHRRRAAASRRRAGRRHTAQRSADDGAR